MSNSADDDAPPMLRFEWSLRALAQDPEVQIACFPPGACVADELALALEEHLGGISRRGLLTSLTDEQRGAVEELDAKLESLSGPDNDRYWTDAALRTDPEWVDIRILARRVLAAMGWPETAPPPARTTYVGP